MPFGNENDASQRGRSPVLDSPLLVPKADLLSANNHPPRIARISRAQRGVCLHVYL